MSWEEVTFGDLYKQPSRNGLTKPSRVRGEGEKFINMGELFKYDRMFDPPTELAPINEKEQETHSLQVGDLLFARQSLVASGAGKCSIVKEISYPTTFDSHIIRVRLIPEMINSDWAYYFFRSPTCTLKSLVQQGVQAGIRGKDLQRLKIPLPPIPIQKRIADILSAYDDLIENNLKRIKLLEETAQNIYREWFVNFRFPGYEDAEFGEDGVPVGWERKTIGDVCEVITGKTPPKKEPRNYGKGFPFIKTPDMHNSLFVTTTAEQISEYGAESVHKKIIPKYSIMVSCIGSAGAVGITQRDSITNQQINSMVLKAKFDFTYLACFAKTLKSHLENIGSNGATMTNVNKEKFSNIELLYPSEALREKFFATSNPMFLQCQLLVNEVQKLSEARDILLPRLMNRTIEVGL